MQNDRRLGGHRLQRRRQRTERPRLAARVSLVAASRVAIHMHGDAAQTCPSLEIARRPRRSRERIALRMRRTRHTFERRHITNRRVPIATADILRRAGNARMRLLLAHRRIPAAIRIGDTIDTTPVEAHLIGLRTDPRVVVAARNAGVVEADGRVGACAHAEVGGAARNTGVAIANRRGFVEAAVGIETFDADIVGAEGAVAVAEGGTGRVGVVGGAAGGAALGVGVAEGEAGVDAGGVEAGNGTGGGAGFAVGIGLGTAGLGLAAGRGALGGLGAGALRGHAVGGRRTVGGARTGGAAVGARERVDAGAGLVGIVGEADAAAAGAVARVFGPLRQTAVAIFGEAAAAPAIGEPRVERFAMGIAASIGAMARVADVLGCVPTRRSVVCGAYSQVSRLSHTSYT